MLQCALHLKPVVESSHREDFVAHKVKANNFGPVARGAVAKMTLHRLTHHFAELGEGFALGGDGVPESRSDIAALGLVLTNFEDDFTHARNRAALLSQRKPATNAR